MIEKHVTSLELSKKLAEAGFESECHYWWWRIVHLKRQGQPKEWKLYLHGPDTKAIEAFPAYLASELLEALPKYVQLTKSDDEYSVEIYDRKSEKWYGESDIHANTPADALALMTLDLIKKGVMK